MALQEWQEQGYHLVGVLITFGFAWLGILIAISVNRYSTRATSLLNIFAGGVLFSGGIVHLLGDALNILRQYSSNYGQLVALFLGSATYILLFTLNTFITGYFGIKLKKHQKKTDKVRLMVDMEDDNLTFSPEIALTSSDMPFDETQIFIASLQHSGLRSSVIFMSVLSVHSFLAGLAFGSQPDPAEEFKIMIPIAAHKSLAAMALTITLKNSHVTKANMCVLLLLFSCSTPLGTFVGMIISASVKSSLWTGICLAVASGTFLFVTLNDIIPTEILKNTDLLAAKCGALCLGYCLMTLLALWV